MLFLESGLTPLGTGKVTWTEDKRFEGKLKHLGCVTGLESSFFTFFGVILTSKLWFPVCEVEIMTVANQF